MSRVYGGYSRYLFGGPHYKDYSILGSILGSPYLRKLTYIGGRGGYIGKMEKNMETTI